MTKTDIYASVTAKVITALQEGTVPWRMPWVGGYPVNVDHGRRYRGANVFLLSLIAGVKNYSDNRWGTFNACRKVAVAEARREGREIIVETGMSRGRKKDFFHEIIDGEKVFFPGGVRKGETATWVILWKRTEPSKKKLLEDPDAKPFMILKQFPVFNVAQCDGIAPLPDAFDHDPIEAAVEIVRGYVPNGPLIQNAAGGAWYRPSDDIVNCPSLDKFERVEAYYSTLYHELVHSTGHESRLDRLETTGFGSGPYAKEELVAEMGAAMLCGIAGIDNLDQSAAYVKNWLGRLQDDPKLVVQAAAYAQKAADLILGVTFDNGETPEPETAALIAA
jgi:antirestriction protein ArdC